jgi:hypothetical protein
LFAVNLGRAPRRPVVFVTRGDQKAHLKRVPLEGVASLHRFAVHEILVEDEVNLFGFFVVSILNPPAGAVFLPLPTDKACPAKTRGPRLRSNGLPSFIADT